MSSSSHDPRKRNPIRQNPISVRVAVPTRPLPRVSLIREQKVARGRPDRFGGAALYVGDAPNQWL
jgi:hypothetical protein